MKFRNLILASLVLLSNHLKAWDSTIVYHDVNGRLVYKSDEDGNRLVDFSHAGYKSGNVSLPVLPVVKTISPVAGDNSSNIQTAINQVASMAPNANGHRGAILLTAGVYNVSSIIRLNASGIVLRGVGQGDGAMDTVIVATTTLARTSAGIIDIKPSTTGDPVAAGTRQKVTSSFIPAGCRTISVEDASVYSVGDHLVIEHLATDKWLDAVNYGNTAGDEVLWAPGDPTLDMYFHGTVTAISGNQIKLDSPIYHSLDRTLAQAEVYRHSGAGLVRECGIENLRVISANLGGTDELHANHAVYFTRTKDCWAKDTTVKGYVIYGFAAKSSSRISVLNCSAIDPVSNIQGGRRYPFTAEFDSHDILFKGAYARNNRHCFVGNGGAGINGIVFTQSTSDHTYSTSEVHRRWGAAFLWDDITWTDPQTDELGGFYNRGANGTSHGWTGTGLVAWNLSVPANGKWFCEKPPLGQNFALGVDAAVTYRQYPEMGFVEGSGLSPSISSLYEAQLAERLTYGVGPDTPGRLRVSHSRNTGSRFAVLEWIDTGLDENSFVIERSSDGGVSYTPLATVPSNRVSYTDTTVAANGNYHYRIYAENAIGKSAFSNPVHVNLALAESPVNSIYQAENFSAANNSSFQTWMNYYTGKGFMQFAGSNSWVELDVDGGRGGSATLKIRYTSTSFSRSCDLVINGVKVADINFPTTPILSPPNITWTVQTFNTVSVNVNLQVGINKVRIAANSSGDSNLLLDRFEVAADPAIHAAGETAPGGEATAAFDGDPMTHWTHYSPHESWLQRAYGFEVTAPSYTITSSIGAEANDPKDWVLEGSNNGGSTWTALDSRTGVIFDSRNEAKTFTIASPQAMKLFRLSIGAVRNLAQADSVQIADLQIAGLPAINPNPAEFAVAPEALSHTSIRMTAVTGASTLGPVEYFFEETSGNPGGSDSGWITSPSYVDTGLLPGTEYSYVVRMRDIPENIGTSSAVASAATGRVIVQDGFSGTSATGNGMLAGRTPDTVNLPGITYTEQQNANNFARMQLDTSVGIPGNGNSLRTGFDNSAHIQFNNTGSLPTPVTLSIDLQLNTIVAGTGLQGIGLGFWSPLPILFPATQPTATNDFTGILVNPDGRLQYVRGGASQGVFTTAPPGFSKSAFYNLTYTVDSSTGAMVHLEFAGISYTAAFNSTFPANFTVSNNAGFLGNTATDSNFFGRVDNFIVAITRNLPPESVITSLPSSVSFLSGEPIVIEVNASDSDGGIARVEFYDGENLLATVVSPPYAYTWNQVPLGNFTLSVKTTDNFWASTVATVQVEVVPNSHLQPEVRTNGNFFILHWDASLIGRDYQIDRSFDLEDWHPFVSYRGDGLEKEVSDSMSNDHPAFYRTALRKLPHTKE